MCVCVCERERESVCVCVCVCERERERESVCVCVGTHSVSKQKPRVAERHVFQKAVEVTAGEIAPGTLHVSPRLSLLQAIAVVEKVIHHSTPFISPSPCLGSCND